MTFFDWLRSVNWDKMLNRLMSALSVASGSAMASGLIEDPRLLKACGLASAILAAAGFQRSPLPVSGAVAKVLPGQEPRP